MKQPPLPSEVLFRVMRVGRIDGASVLGLSGTFALLSAAAHDVPGALVGLAVAAAGGIELHGVGLLRNARSEGLRWLVFSQLYLMTLILGYVIFRLNHLDVADLRDQVTPEISAQIAQLKMSVDDFLYLMMRCTFIAIGAATLLYQSSMMVYYLRRRDAIALALDEPGPG